MSIEITLAVLLGAPVVLLLFIPSYRLAGAIAAIYTALSFYGGMGSRPPADVVFSAGVFGIAWMLFLLGLVALRRKLGGRY